MRGEPIELPCPFCESGKIQCWYIAGAWSHKMKKTKTLPGSGTVSKSSDVWLIQSGCTVCGKNAEEVESKLREKGMI